MPKAASTFLARAVGSLHGMRIKPVAIGGGRNEQDLDPVRLAYNDSTTYVAQHHVRYGNTTAELIQEFGITPIVLVRNLADAMASMLDHIETEEIADPSIWLTNEHMNLPREDRERVIADLMLPWYVQFYVGWTTCNSAVWVTFDEVRTDPQAVVRRVAKSAGISYAEDDLRRAVSKASDAMPRFNKGISGRGADLSDYMHSRIAALVAHYPNVDFSPVI